MPICSRHCRNLCCRKVNSCACNRPKKAQQKESKIKKGGGKNNKKKRKHREKNTKKKKQKKSLVEPRPEKWQTNPDQRSDWLVSHFFGAAPCFRRKMKYGEWKKHPFFGSKNNGLKPLNITFALWEAMLKFSHVEARLLPASLGLGPWVLGLRSWVLVFGLWVLSLGSWALDLESWLGPWVLGLKPWVLCLGS